ncbi:MAG: hypothetical protein R2911_32940 [Caldilineaceae bacterium]
MRGYAGALLDGSAEATQAEVLATPDDVYMQFKLQDVITPQRIRWSALSAPLHETSGQQVDCLI